MTPFGVTGNERVELNPGLETRYSMIRNPHKTVRIDNKMTRPMTALTDINLRAYTNIKHKSYIGGAVKYCIFTSRLRL